VKPYGSSIPLLPTNPASSVALPLPNFLSEISGFSTALGTFTAGISEVAALHDSALLSTESETAYGSGASARLEAKVAECSSQAKQLKDVVKYLERDVLLTEREASVSGDMSAARTKRAQAEKARRDLQAALREFETVRRGFFHFFFHCPPSGFEDADGIRWNAHTAANIGI
jgi:multidrug efflux pump subunit AcrA (membrane-fusion protein)